MDIQKRKTPKNISTESETDIFLKKHVGLIHCENKLTLIQRKICNILLFVALDNIEQEIHEISLRQLCSLVGYNSNDIKLIKESIKSLISVVMEWNLLEDSKFLSVDDCTEETITWNASSLLAGASIKKGVIRYSYSPQMKSVLSSLAIYGRINLFVQSKFNSTYSLVLYENCVRFKNLKQTSWFPIELFRPLMGVPKEKYSSFKEFNRNVINVAVKEINQKADIFLIPQFKKTGRHITSVQFSLSENPNYLPTFKKPQRVEQIPQQQSILLELLVSEFKLSQKQAKVIVAGYSYAYIVEKMTLVKSKKNIAHMGAYLLAALKEDYKKQEIKVIAPIPIPPNEDPCRREAKAASEIISLKHKYLSYKTKVYTQFVKQHSETIQQAVQEKFEQCLRAKTEIMRLYKKAGFNSPFVMTDFIAFLEAEFAHVIGEYLSFDDYISSEEG
jgi:hypothetical protein